MWTHGRPREAGFTLLEVVIAVAIAGTALLALIQAFGIGLRLADAADRSATAVLRAQSKLEEVGSLIPLTPGRHAGTFPDGSAWEVTIDPFGAPKVMATEPERFLLHQVQVSVAARGQKPSVLRTLRLGATP